MSYEFLVYFIHSTYGNLEQTQILLKNFCILNDPTFINDYNLI